VTPAATIRKATRDLCTHCIDRALPGHDPEATARWIEIYHDCYKIVRDQLGLTMATRNRDIGLVASELRKMLNERNRK
jgi:hypothetical protein